MVLCCFFIFFSLSSFVFFNPQLPFFLGFFFSPRRFLLSAFYRPLLSQSSPSHLFLLPRFFQLTLQYKLSIFLCPFTPSPLPLLADLSPISPSASCLFFPHICPNLIRQQEDNRDCFIHHTHTHTFLTHTYLLYLHTHKAHTHSPRAVR